MWLQTRMFLLVALMLGILRGKKVRPSTGDKLT